MISPNKINLNAFNAPDLPRNAGLGRSRTSYYWYLGFLSTFALVCYFWQFEPVPLDVQLIVIIVVAIAIFPMFRWWYKGRGEAPLFEMLCLSYGLQHGAILYFGPNEVNLLYGKLSLSWDNTRYALVISAIGIFSLCFGYYRAGDSRLLRLLPELNLQMNKNRQNWYFGIAIIVGFFGLGLTTLGIVKSTDALGQVVFLLHTQLNIAIFLLTLSIERHKLGSIWKIILYLLLGLMISYGLSRGTLDDVMTSLVVYVVARWQCEKRAPIRVIILLLVIFLILQPIKQEYRLKAWQGGDATALSLKERADIWYETFANTLLSSESQSSRIENDNTRSQIIGRLDLLHIEAHVLNSTPDSVPYFYGSTYSYLAVAFIPRVFWPGKPEAQDANKTFVLAYGFLNEEMIQFTIMGIGHIAEAYVNFGIIGVMLIMLVQGSIFATFAKVLNGEKSEGGVAIYTIIMITFFNGIGSATAGLFGGIVQLAVSEAIILAPFILYKKKNEQFSKE